MLNRISKITPPKYLPDIRKYIHDMLHEGKFYPIPMMLVHADETDQLKQRSRRNRQRGNRFSTTDDTTPDTLPLYQGTISPPEQQKPAIPAGTQPTGPQQPTGMQQPTGTPQPTASSADNETCVSKYDAYNSADAIQTRRSLNEQLLARRRKYQTKLLDRQMDNRGNTRCCSVKAGVESSTSRSSGPVNIEGNDNK